MNPCNPKNPKQGAGHLCDLITRVMRILRLHTETLQAPPVQLLDLRCQLSKYVVRIVKDADR